jgi:hypothetical protein
MYGTDLLRESLRQRLENNSAMFPGKIAILRQHHISVPDETSIVNEILKARQYRQIADRMAGWLKDAEAHAASAKTIDDLLVVLGGDDRWKELDAMTPAEIASLPPLSDEQLEQARQYVDDRIYTQDDGTHMTWADATGTATPPPPGWDEPMRARGRAKAGTGNPDDGTADPTDTVPPRPSGPAEMAEERPDGTIRDAQPPAPAEQAGWGPPTVKTGLEAAGAAATVAAAAKRGIDAIRILRFGAGGVIVLVLAYGAWRLWGYTAGPGASAGPSSPPAGAGQLEALTAEGQFDEKASAYVTSPFKTVVTVHGGRYPGLGGSVDLTLEGETEFETTYDCYAQPPGSVSGAPRTLFVERKPIMAKLAYEKIDISTKDIGTYDESAGTFSMPIKPRIVRSFYLLLQKFTDSRCLHYNDVGPQPDWTDEFFGTGTVDGSVSFGNGSAIVHTRWEWGNGIKVEGQTTLDGKVERL